MRSAGALLALAFCGVTDVDAKLSQCTAEALGRDQKPLEVTMFRRTLVRAPPAAAPPPPRPLGPLLLLLAAYHRRLLISSNRQDGAALGAVEHKDGPDDYLSYPTWFRMVDKVFTPAKFDAWADKLGASDFSADT